MLGEKLHGHPNGLGFGEVGKAAMAGGLFGALLYRWYTTRRRKQLVKSLVHSALAFGCYALLNHILPGKFTLGMLTNGAKCGLILGALGVFRALRRRGE